MALGGFMSKEQVEGMRRRDELKSEGERAALTAHEGICDNCGEYGELEYAPYFGEWECDACIEIGHDIEGFNRENAIEIAESGIDR